MVPDSSARRSARSREPPGERLMAWSGWGRGRCRGRRQNTPPAARRRAFYTTDQKHLLCRHAEGGGADQQSFIDTYAKVAFAKLYDRKTPIRASRSAIGCASHSFARSPLRGNRED